MEICIGGTWGTACQDVFWGDADAQVICRQIGYENPREALAVIAGEDYGSGTGPIYLNGLNCTGNETRITDCQTLNQGGLRFCTHLDDVAVICRGTHKLSLSPSYKHTHTHTHKHILIIIESIEYYFDILQDPM